MTNTTKITVYFKLHQFLDSFHCINLNVWQYLFLHEDDVLTIFSEIYFSKGQILLLFQ